METSTGLTAGARFDAGYDDYMWVLQHTAVMGANPKQRYYWGRAGEIWTAAIARGGEFTDRERNELKTMRVEMGG